MANSESREGVHRMKRTSRGTCPWWTLLTAAVGYRSAARVPHASGRAPRVRDDDRVGARRGASQRRRRTDHGLADPYTRSARDGDEQARATGRVGASDVAQAKREYTADRGQAGPRAGDGRAVVLLIPGRRGATQPRRGRAWREESSCPRRGESPSSSSSLLSFLFFKPTRFTGEPIVPR